MLHNKQKPWFGVDQRSPRHKLSTMGKSWHKRVLEMPTEIMITMDRETDSKRDEITRMSEAKDCPHQNR